MSSDVMQHLTTRRWISARS